MDHMEGPAETGLPVSCQCGYISFRTPTPRPTGIAHCHCNDCRKQSSSAFGTSAYWASDGMFPLPPDLEARLASFTRLADSGNTMHCYFCPRCGVRIFHAAYLPDGSLRALVSFKAGCIDGLDWTGAKHIFTRSAVIRIPEDAEQYETVPGA